MRSVRRRKSRGERRPGRKRGDNGEIGCHGVVENEKSALKALRRRIRGVSRGCGVDGLRVKEKCTLSSSSEGDRKYPTSRVKNPPLPRRASPIPSGLK